MKYVVAILAIVIGVAGIVAGGLDDAPGAQLLGVVIIVHGSRARSLAPLHRTRLT
jgi:hypothetical protein